MCVNSVNAELEAVYEDYVKDPKAWPTTFRFAHVDCTDSPNLCHRCVGNPHFVRIRPAALMLIRVLQAWAAGFPVGCRVLSTVKGVRHVFGEQPTTRACWVGLYPVSRAWLQGNRNRDEISSFVALPPDQPRRKIDPPSGVVTILLEYVESLMTTIEYVLRGLFWLGDG